MVNVRTRVLLLLVCRLVIPPFFHPCVVVANSVLQEEAFETDHEQGCVDLITEKGRYIMKGSSVSDYCVSMLVAAPDHFIVANVTNLSVDCARGFIELQDGIEIDAGTFPTEKGLAYLDSCRGAAFVVSASNVAQLLYDIEKSEKFVLDVDFRKSARPCNMLLEEGKGKVVITSTPSIATTCTIFLPYPTHVNIKLTQEPEINGGYNALYNSGKGVGSEALSKFGRGVGNSGKDLFEMFAEEKDGTCTQDYMEVRGGEKVSFNLMTPLKIICPSSPGKARSSLLRSRNSGKSFMWGSLNGGGGRMGGGMMDGDGGHDGGGNGGGVGVGGGEIGGGSVSGGRIKKGGHGEITMNLLCSFSKLKLVMSGRKKVTATVEYRTLDGEEDSMNYQC